MGALLGLVLGTGLLLVWTACCVPRRPRTRSRTPGRLPQMLAAAGLAHVAPSGVIAVSVVAGGVSLLVVQAISQTFPVALAFAVMASSVPLMVLSSRARKRQHEFAEVWPEAVDNLASAVRAGMSLPDAVSALGSTGPEPLRPAFGEFGIDYQLTGRFNDSLDALKARLADPVGDRVVEGLRIAREVGGGELGRLLRNLSGYLRDDLRTRSEMLSRQAWVVNGARMAVAAPWLVLLFMSFQTEAIHRYASPVGAAVLLVGGVLCLVAYRAMLRIGRLPTERRILA